ncbi:nuclear protein, partial [Mycena rebaudengoi]
MAPKKRLPVTGSAPTPNATSAALRIVGQCALCRAQFCGAHRMPEHHSCNDLEDCRKAAFDKNAASLVSSCHTAEQDGHCI